MTLQKIVMAIINPKSSEFVLRWPKGSFKFFQELVWKNLIELLGQPNI